MAEEEGPDLNKVSETELLRHKENMNATFESNRLKPATRDTSTTVASTSEQVRRAATATATSTTTTTATTAVTTSAATTAISTSTTTPSAADEDSKEANDWDDELEDFESEDEEDLFAGL